MDDRAAWLEGTIRDFIGSSPENTLQNRENDRAWDDPLVGFSRGDDPLYATYKDVVGPFHWTPREWFGLAFPRSQAEAKELTVVSWVLPHTEKTRSAIRKAKADPPESWVRARIFGEQVNAKLRRHVVETLAAAGFEAMAPLLSPHWHMKYTDILTRYPYASVWSERHAAYAAGLGTFSLNDALITARGISHRCGSVIARIDVPPTPRPYTDHRAYCLFFSWKGRCGKCIARCPAGAIGPEGHDKRKCMDYLVKTAEYTAAHYGFDGYGCGFCQAGVPCEAKIPAPPGKSRKAASLPE